MTRRLAAPRAAAPPGRAHRARWAGSRAPRRRAGLRARPPPLSARRWVRRVSAAAESESSVWASTTTSWGRDGADPPGGVAEQPPGLGQQRRPGPREELVGGDGDPDRADRLARLHGAVGRRLGQRELGHRQRHPLHGEAVGHLPRRRPPAALRRGPRPGPRDYCAQRHTRERPHVGHHHVHRRHAAGRGAERRAQADGHAGRPRARGQGPRLHTQRPLASRATRYWRRFGRVDHRDAVEHVVPLVAAPLEQLLAPVAEQLPDPHAALGVLVERHRRVEHDASRRCGAARRCAAERAPVDGAAAGRHGGLLARRGRRGLGRARRRSARWPSVTVTVRASSPPQAPSAARREQRRQRAQRPSHARPTRAAPRAAPRRGARTPRWR